MNKAELVEQIQKDMGRETPRAAAERALNAVLEGVTKGLRKDGNVQLVGFGTFNVRRRKARDGRNPQTGEPIKIAASKTVGFRAGQNLKGTI